MKTLKTTCIIVLMIICILCLSACQESDEARYDRAQKLVGEGKYFEATSLLDQMPTYEDASRLSMYAKALALAESGEYGSAITAFRALGDYKDSSMMITYYTGRQYEESAGAQNWSTWIAAAEYYDMVHYFMDSKSRAEACRKAVYEEAVRLAENGEYGQSAEMLGALKNYSDSADLKRYYTAFRLEQGNRFRTLPRLLQSLATTGIPQNRLSWFSSGGLKKRISWSGPGAGKRHLRSSTISGTTEKLLNAPANISMTWAWPNGKRRTGTALSRLLKAPVHTATRRNRSWRRSISRPCTNGNSRTGTKR